MTPPTETTIKPPVVAEATSKGGRSGTVTSPDGLLNLTLGSPQAKGSEKRGPNPELLFAAAYSACFHGALINAAKKVGTIAENSTVRACVSLTDDSSGGSRLSVELRAKLPGFEAAQAQTLMNSAHKTCPYSRALRGDADVTLVVE